MRVSMVLLWAAGLVLYGQSLYFPPIHSEAWDTLSAQALGWDTAQIDSLDAFLAQHRTKAFLLLKDGRIVLERYYGTFSRDSLWYWASAGKTLTAFLVGIAQAEGYLRISDPTSRWLGAGWTQAPPEKESRITIWHQLTMTTGLEDEVADPNWTLPSCLLYRADAGTRWAYHNAPYTLLHAVLEAATGTSVSSYFQQKVAARTGMRGFFVRAGYNRIFVSNARSMARFGLLILDGGRWEETPILPDAAYFQAMLRPSQRLNPSYGYLWWLNGQGSFMVPGAQIVFPGLLFPGAPRDMVCALGKNGQILDVVPSERLVVVRLGEDPGGGIVPFQLNEVLWQRLNKLMRPGAAFLAPQSEEAETVLAFQAGPNPFTDRLVITFRLQRPTSVSLTLYDLLGKAQQTIIPGILQPGEHTIACNGTSLPSGIYLLVLRAGSQEFQRLVARVE